ncbi:helix-turn-helix transcriptional regulator [Aeromonas caviae]|uniref:Helix-turn-helix domain-containing protein n=1 Tax=Aeromonas caviae TaxID=648 RepID=A0A7T3X112_AERCA|nr:helix-turn-helix transcriptional regulator [Aeromonas caviae]QQA60053.1 helix-turn-helix domain-containing protein [Aeromonas caviae]
MKITNFCSAEDISQELGARLKRSRLNLNITQTALAELAGVTRKKVMSAEAGNADLVTVAALLRVLGIADQLENFLPQPPLSPVQLAKLHGRQRQRASGDKGYW